MAVRNIKKELVQQHGISWKEAHAVIKEAETKVGSAKDPQALVDYANVKLKGDEPQQQPQQPQDVQSTTSELPKSTADPEAGIQPTADQQPDAQTTQVVGEQERQIPTQEEDSIRRQEVAAVPDTATHNPPMCGLLTVCGM
eukprot:CAMPEP_0194028028 /NCGR_PEP_ID=MMETSP0009_2-20130614/2056_1 /TAXON_ID=210454 /ORGANISM="Grammatophora oceanica, Strain CCMP 410" /LENGTH=140 /DNA_ID=CAMNT_0038667265 /DNA_START=117 /DNA_END=539 /DNA_ORIENTATION=+